MIFANTVSVWFYLPPYGKSTLFFSTRLLENRLYVLLVLNVSPCAKLSPTSYWKAEWGGGRGRHPKTREKRCTQIGRDIACFAVPLVLKGKVTMNHNRAFVNPVFIRNSSFSWNLHGTLHSVFSFLFSLSPHPPPPNIPSSHSAPPPPPHTHTHARTN